MKVQKEKIQHGGDLSGANMAMMLDEFCNRADESDVKEFVDQLIHRTHRTLQQRIMNLMVSSIEKWASLLEEREYDARNEATVKLAKKMIAATGDKYDRFLPLI